MDEERPSTVTTTGLCSGVYFFGDPISTFDPEFKKRTTTMRNACRNTFYPTMNLHVLQCHSILIKTIERVLIGLHSSSSSSRQN
jgi:hypothetical protein